MPLSDDLRGHTVPDLSSYDHILVNTSAGKDSQAALDVTVDHADRAGVRHRLVAVHADLGRIEWPGTKDLAAEHAAHYGLPFEVVRNRAWGDLLERIEARGMWPDANNRYCTSEFKTGPVRTLMTRLVRETRTAKGQPIAGPGARSGRRVRILNVLGLRADESPARARLAAFELDRGSSNSLRHVDRWLPVHAWTVDEVWDRIADARTRPHPAYGLGLPRLSCSFCVLASRGALVRSAQVRPRLAAEYAAAEERMGHRFRHDLSMAEVVALADRAEHALGPVESWAG